MPIDPNLARWTFASVVTHLKAVATTDSHLAIVEGVDEKTDSILEAPIWAEIRMTGPFVQQQQGQYRVNVDANVLITCNSDARGYEISRIAGLYQEALSTPIPVWNFGDQPGDWVEGDEETQVLLGCLSAKPGRAESVAVFHFGQIEKTDKVRQALADASLEMFLPRGN